MRFSLRVVVNIGALMWPLSRGYQLTATMIVPDAVLELSVEQLISALNKKLFMECTQVQAAIPLMSRTLVATLTAEVRSYDLKRDLEC